MDRGNLIDEEGKYRGADFKPGEWRVVDKLPLTQADLDRVLSPAALGQHEAGAKLDAGKNMLGLVLGGFARALMKVGWVGTSGAVKYTPNGWKEVENAEARYMDAMLRHQMLYLSGETIDPESGQPHLAHMAWNSLALLEFSELKE